MSLHSDEKEAAHPDFPHLEQSLTEGIVTAARQHGHTEKRDGRWVLDPEEARQEFGDDIASKLQLSKDGRTVLWPQPLGGDDPQSWSEGRKRKMLAIAALAAIVPDFSSGVGIAALFNLAAQFNTTTAEINNLTSNWSIFLLGWGGIVSVILARRYGRLPVLFWSQVFGAAFMCGCTFSQSLSTFAAMRCLQSFFSTAPQVLGLYIVSDIYPVHRQNRAIAIWTLAYIGEFVVALGGNAADGVNPNLSVAFYLTLAVWLLVCSSKLAMGLWRWYPLHPRRRGCNRTFR